MAAENAPNHVPANSYRGAEQVARMLNHAAAYSSTSHPAREVDLDLSELLLLRHVLPSLFALLMQRKLLGSHMMNSLRMLDAPLQFRGLFAFEAELYLVPRRACLHTPRL